MSQPNFYAIIPASVRYDETVCANAKLLYGEISAMCNAEGFCWAENGYFAKLYNVSHVSISRWISQLVKGNYIYTDLNKSEGNTRKIFIVDAAVTLLTKKAIPINKNDNTLLTKKIIPINKNVKSNIENITINNTINRESTSLAFFEVNFPSEFERLMMQYKSQIINWDDFVKSFEATVDQEGLEFKLNVLRGRFGKYAQNWIRNQNKFNGKVVEMVPNGPIKKINSL
jgi:hypothetical protein